MARRGHLSKRSPKEWGFRLFLASLAGVVGYHAVAQSLAEVAVRKGAIKNAYWLAPRNARVLALMAQKQFETSATAAERAKADALALAALRLDPTAVAAVTTLGLNAGFHGDGAGAVRLFTYSETLSRRDFRTQLWAVENAVNRGDIPGALHEYDIALRTSRNAPALMFPILASAISNPSIRVSLIRTLIPNPSWRHAFIEFAAESGSDPRATADLFRGLRHAGVPVSNQAKATVINALVAKHFIDDAWSFYLSLHPGADRRMSRDPRFAATTDTPSSFDWVALGTQGIGASFQRNANGGIFDFSTPASIGGPLLQQLQLLPPGKYQLMGHSAGISQPSTTLPYWTLSCASGRELGRVVVPNSAQANGVFAGSLMVPSDCPIQSLVLVAPPSDSLSGVSGQIDQVRLRPAG